MLRAYKEAADLIKQADGLLIGAGAGMGVDSGLPDFRGDAGFWNAYPALGRLGLGFADIACPSTFESDPALAWGFYGHRLALYRRTEPHAGFEILKRLAAYPRHGAMIFTSNVDGQFERAGFSATDIVQCHGSIHEFQCAQPCHEATWPAARQEPQIDEEACRWIGRLPSCPACGGVARPNILMFGDWGWLGQSASRSAARLHAWLGSLSHPVVIELGAGTTIPSVRAQSAAAARQHDALVIRINPRDHDLGRLRGISLPVGALDGLLGISAAMEN